MRTLRNRRPAPTQADTEERLFQRRTPGAPAPQLAAGALEDIPVPVVVCDREGTIVVSNRSAREALGAPAAPFAADEWAARCDFRIRGGAPLAGPPLADALAGEDIRELEIEARTAESRYVLSVTGGPVRDTSGEIAGAVLVMRDVTARAAADARLRLSDAIATNIASGVALVRAADGEIVYANDAWEHMLGYEPGKLIGRQISTVTAPAEHAPEARAQEIIRALERDGAWSGEIHNVRGDGTRFWAAATISAFDHPEHGATWIVVETDISERKAAEEALRIVEERFRNVFEEAPVGIAVVGNDLRVVDANHVLCEITGYAREELLGKSLAQFTYPDDVELDAELAAKAFSGEIPRYRVNKRYVTKQGDVIAVAITATYVRDAADRPLHTIVIVERLAPPAR